MDNWIYWVQEITPSMKYTQGFYTTDINVAFNELGRLGWELISVVQTQPLVLLAFFKRKLVV